MKMEGRKINREYGSWLRAKGLGFKFRRKDHRLQVQLVKALLIFHRNAHELSLLVETFRWEAEVTQLRWINVIKGGQKSLVGKGNKFQ